MTAHELNLDSVPHDEYMIPHIQDAIDLASDQDQMTWLISDGKRVAAIVPAGDAEYMLSRDVTVPPREDLPVTPDLRSRLLRLERRYDDLNERLHAHRHPVEAAQRAVNLSWHDHAPDGRVLRP